MSATLGPLFERLIGAGFVSLSGTGPTALVGAGADGRYFFQAPKGWRSELESSREKLSERTTELLSAGPVLLVPPWDREPSAAVTRKAPPLPAFRPVLSELRPAGPDSVLGLLLPLQTWTSEARWAADLRVSLAEHWDTHLVIYGRGALDGVHGALTMTVAFLKTRAARRPPLKIFRFSNADDETAVENDLGALLSRGGGRTRNGYVVRQPPAPADSLAFELHDPSIEARRADLAGFGSVEELNELCDQLQTPNTPDMRNWQCPAETPGAVRLLGGRDVTRYGTIAPVSDDSVWGRMPEQYLLAPGDILVRTIQDVAGPEGLILAQVTKQDLPAAATNMVIPLRPRKGLDSQHLRLAIMFMRTPLARSLLAAPEAGYRLTGSRLRKLPIPRPDEALTKALEDVAAAKHRLETWQREADQLLESVFLEKTATIARSKVIASGQALRMRVETASLLDDLGYTVRTRFPYPVAARWRDAEAQTSTPNTQDALVAVLDTAEILLCYTAQLALALAWNAGIELGSADAIKTKLAGGRSGPGFGEWAFVLDEASTTRKLRSLPTTHPLHEIRTLLATEEATKARQRLSDHRNDQAHQRRIHPIDLPHTTAAALTDLMYLLQRARFLADWPLVHITAVRWDTLTRTATIDYRELTGDHPVVPTRTTTTPRNDLETGSLYLRDSNHELHLLRPFLIGRDCPTCQLWSTFHVDRAPKDAVILKSLEHGHTLTDTAPAMRASLHLVDLL